MKIIEALGVTRTVLLGILFSELGVVGLVIYLHGLWWRRRPKDRKTTWR